MEAKLYLNTFWVVRITIIRGIQLKLQKEEINFCIQTHSKKLLKRTSSTVGIVKMTFPFSPDFR